MTWKATPPTINAAKTMQRMRAANFCFLFILMIFTSITGDFFNKYYYTTNQTKKKGNRVKFSDCLQSNLYIHFDLTRCYITAYQIHSNCRNLDLSISFRGILFGCQYSASHLLISLQGHQRGALRGTCVFQ